MLWILFRQLYNPGYAGRHPLAGSTWQLHSLPVSGRRYLPRLLAACQASPYQPPIPPRCAETSSQPPSPRTPAEHLDERAGNKQTEQQAEDDISAVAAEFDPEHAPGFPL
jgi:hypothetical protein